MTKAPREWQNYKYYDPDKMLPLMLDLRRNLVNFEASARVKDLRTNKLRKHRENWDAAIFCKLMSIHIEKKLYFSIEESSDFDNIFMHRENNDQFFWPVQMKELVPDDLNPKASLKKIIDGTRKYVDSENLVVAIKLNRTERIEFNKSDYKNLPIAEVWCFGAVNQDRSEWCLIGDLIKGAGKYHYKWPYA